MESTPNAFDEAQDFLDQTEEASQLSELHSMTVEFGCEVHTPEIALHMDGQSHNIAEFYSPQDLCLWHTRKALLATSVVIG